MTQALAGRAPNERPADPHEYLSAQFRALRNLYMEAAGRGLCTVMKWD